jgi:hypothetical protein
MSKEADTAEKGEIRPMQTGVASAYTTVLG